MEDIRGAAERHIPNSIATMRRRLIIAPRAAPVATPVLSKSNASTLGAGKFVTQ
jgi:hypothetical protein